MKYEGVDSIGSGGEGNSHTLVMELVGTGKRVLDVGCSTGYLAQDLVQAGNRVSGVEIEAEAAEKARPVLEQLVIGDLDVMDISDELPKKSFDVIIFADVLEHLKDPVRTLSQSKELLDEGGYAVLSIPNVAHAAVRLALLQGRFEYRPVGLLDETHLRFFTRSTHEDLLHEAGFVAKEVRRTTLPPFGTEIPLEPDDFPPDLVSQVEEDPESSTYQFVLTAIPAPGMNKAWREEIARLHDQIAVINRSLRGVPPMPTVGVASAQGPLDEIRNAVVVSELRRRMDGFDVRTYKSVESAEPSELSGEPVYPLPAGDQLEAEVDAIVFTSPAPGAPGETEREDIFAWSTDPIALAGRLLNPLVLDRRARFLQWNAGSRREDQRIILTNVTDDAKGSPLAGLARRRNAEVVPVPASCGPLDLAALVARADLVVTDDPALGFLACGFARPLIMVEGASRAATRWAETAGLAVGPIEALPSLGEDLENRPALPAREELWRDLDLALDELAGRLLSTAGRRMSASAPARISELARRVAVLETVNAGLRRRLETLLGQPENPPPPPSVAATAATASGQMKRSLADAQSHAEHLQDEIDRIYSTKLMKTVQPLRRIYGRLRNLKG